MSLNRATPSLALAAYAETWISGAKVIVFGDSLSPLPERLVQRGARLVQVYDRDAARAAEAAALNPARQKISYAALDSAGSSLRDGVFDFGIVEDLGADARKDGLPLSALRRALGRRGMALIAARNPEVARALIPPVSSAEEPLSYYELYELVSQQFEEVRMLGQTAFVGYAVADFAAAEDSDVRLDTAFLPGGAEEPEWFLALVSTLPVSSEAFSVIQLPLADLPLTPPGEAPVDRPEIERLEQALEQAEARIAELEKEKQRPARDSAKEAQAAQTRQELESHKRQLEAQATQSRQELESHKRQLEAQAAQSRQELESHKRQLDGAAQGRQELELQKRQIEALQAELSKREQWLSGLESRAATADQRADDAQSELDQLTKRVTEATQQKKQLERQLEESQRARRALEESQSALQRQLRELEQGSGAHARNFAELERRAITLSTRVDELTAQLAATKQEQREAAGGQDEAAGELRELEGQLVERGREVARLDRELEHTERFGRQLIVQLEEARSAPNAAIAQPEIEGLARRNAELEADLEAARWTISSLGANVSGAGTASTAGSTASS